MSAHRNRSGPAEEPAIVINAGTTNSQTNPRVLGFDEYASPVIVMNGNANEIFVKVNAAAANDFDNDADDDGIGYYRIEAGETRDVSIGGILSIDKVSFVTTDAGDSLDLVTVVGWRP